ncbi:MAG: hypothetical protein ACOY5B_05730 [Spirochaetota bacterium]
MLQRFLCFVLPLCVTAQLLAGSRAGIAFTPGFLTAQDTIAYGVAAEWELPLAQKLSLRSDAYALVARPQDSNLTQNYQAFVGLAYQFDPLWIIAPFVGFQPGFGFGEVDTPARPGLLVYPAMSPVFGLRAAIGDALECTLALRYVFGELHYRDTGAVYLSELRLAAGLAFRY